MTLILKVSAVLEIKKFNIDSTGLFGVCDLYGYSKYRIRIFRSDAVTFELYR